MGRSREVAPLRCLVPRADQAEDQNPEVFAVEADHARAFRRDMARRRLANQNVDEAPTLNAFGVVGLVEKDDAAGRISAAQQHLQAPVRSLEHEGVAPVVSIAWDGWMRIEKNVGRLLCHAVAQQDGHLPFAGPCAAVLAIGEEQAHRPIRAWHRCTRIGPSLLAGTAHEILARQQRDGLMHPVDAVVARGVPPMHGVPAPTMRIVLVEKVGHAIDLAEAVRDRSSSRKAG